MYTALDLHRTITDPYSFKFQLTDEFDQPISDQLVWMEVGIKPKAGTNFKLIDWTKENGEYADVESFGTAFFMDQGQQVAYGPGDNYLFRSRMFNKPMAWEYKDSETGEINQ